MKVLSASYTFGRKTVDRTVVSDGVCAAVLAIVIAAIAGVTQWRLLQYGLFGAAYGAGLQLVAVHTFTEGALRPARAAIGGDTGIGDWLPRSRPTFAAWANVRARRRVCVGGGGRHFGGLELYRFSGCPLP